MPLVHVPHVHCLLCVLLIYAAYVHCPFAPLVMSECTPPMCATTLCAPCVCGLCVLPLHVTCARHFTPAQVLQHLPF